MNEEVKSQNGKSVKKESSEIPKPLIKQLNVYSNPDEKKDSPLGIYVPQKMFFTNGVGKHKEKLQSFEGALRDAGIQHLNLVTVSSIFPPGCRKVQREIGIQQLKPGQITFLVLARNCTNEPNRLMASSIGLALPSDPNNYGYLSEHHSFGETAERTGDYAEDLAASMLASTLGVKFDENASWDEKRKIWQISEKIVRTMSYTQSAIGDKDGLWTTVIAAAVFLME